jgi:hypothetical protein
MGPFLKRDENLRDKIKILHQHYEFQKVPESWFEIPRIPLPEDHCEINQILKERGVLLINIPLRDNDLLSTNIFELHKIFSFNKLPESMITTETLPDPEFDLFPINF